MLCLCSRYCRGLGPSVGNTISTPRPFARSHDSRQRQITQAHSSSTHNEKPFAMPKSQQASPYDIFHLPRTSSPAQIKARYYELVKIYHPDRILSQVDETQVASSSKKQNATLSTTREKANEDFKRVREAYNVLSNERKRRLYDHSGIGWDPVHAPGVEMDGFGAPVWKGGFPRTAEERQAYEAWSSSLRRGAPGSMNRQGWEFRGRGHGHDRFGWQSYAGDSKNIGSDWFYGYGHARDHQNPKRKPIYTTNSRFFISLSFLTTILGIGQYLRLREESKVVVGLADRRHQDAAKSLDEARNFARSQAGRTRMEEMKKRARERALLEGKDPEAETGWNNLGHGGASGREAYEGRMKRIGWPVDNDE